LFTISIENLSSLLLLKKNSAGCPLLPQWSQWKGIGFGFGFGFSLSYGFYKIMKKI
jgi:hypothetical protein